MFKFQNDYDLLISTSRFNYFAFKNFSLLTEMFIQKKENVPIRTQRQKELTPKYVFFPNIEWNDR